MQEAIAFGEWVLILALTNAMTAFIFWGKGRKSGFEEGAQAITQVAEMTFHAFGRAAKLTFGLDGHREVMHEADKFMQEQGIPQLLKGWRKQNG